MAKTKIYNIGFYEPTHTYSVNNEIGDISITELLAKHGISTSYAGVSLDILRERAEYGKIVHADIEGFLNSTDDMYVPQTWECKEYIKWHAENVVFAKSEYRVGLIDNGLVLAGTIDIFATLKDGRKAVIDIKTTAKCNKDSTAWQTAIGRECLIYMDELNAEENIVHIVLWFDRATKKLVPTELNVISHEQVYELLACEEQGLKYVRPALVVDNDLQLEIEGAESYLQKVESEYKTAKANCDKLKSELMTLFEEQGIYSWETDSLKVTYVAPTVATRLDSTKLKKEYPAIYESYKVESKKAGYMKITHKERGV